MEMKRFLKVIGITLIFTLIQSFVYDLEQVDYMILFAIQMLVVDRFIIRSEKQEITVKSVEVEMELDDVDDMMKQLSERMEMREAQMRKGERVIVKDKAP